LPERAAQDDAAHRRAPPDAVARRAGASYALAGSAAAAVHLLALRAAGAYGKEALVVALLSVAAVASFAWTAAKPGARLRLDRFEHGIALAIAALSVIGNLCIAGAAATLGAGLTGILVQTEVFFVAVLARVALGERLGARFGLGAAIAVAGLVLLYAPDAETGELGAAALLPIGAALAFSAILVLTRGVVHRIDLEGVNSFRLIYAAPATLLVPGAIAVVDLPAAAWAWAAVAGLAGPFVARLFLMHAVRQLPAGHTKLLQLTSPVFAFGLDFAIFAHTPTTTELACSALILCGVAVPAVCRDLRGSS
jgi:DME family drug/metabolite transporter